MGFAPGVLHRLGIDRSALMRSLADRGVSVPPGDPEPLDLTPKRRIDVPYEQLMMILRELPARLPDPTRFGFNLHNETSRAWIVVDEEVDAQSLVGEILARHDA